jgi:rare lipoprotein A
MRATAKPGRWRWRLLWAIGVVVVEGCATVPSPPPDSTIETGRASWYGEAHQGRPTASGEPFDMNALTAAHPSLPFGTRLRVENLDNEREVEVRVNDRGPSVPGRIIDLSYAAARVLGAVGAGIILVRVTVLP